MDKKYTGKDWITIIFAVCIGLSLISLVFLLGFNTLYRNEVDLNLLETIENAFTYILGMLSGWLMHMSVRKHG